MPDYLRPHPEFNGRWQIHREDDTTDDLTSGDELELHVQGAWVIGRVEYVHARTAYVFTGLPGWPILADCVRHEARRSDGRDERDVAAELAQLRQENACLWQMLNAGLMLYYQGEAGEPAPSATYVQAGLVAMLVTERELRREAEAQLADARRGSQARLRKNKREARHVAAY